MLNFTAVRKFQNYLKILNYLGIQRVNAIWKDKYMMPNGAALLQCVGIATARKISF
jgi:hypothetical protein